MQSISLIPALALLVQAASQPALPIKAKWVINYADSFCLLSRDRTSTEPGVAFRTRPFADEHEILLMLPPTNERPFNQKGKLFVGGAAPGDDRWIAMVVSKKANVKAIETTIKIDEMAEVMASGRVRISIPNRLDAAAQLPNIAKALVALRACEDDLAKRWNIVRSWAVAPKPIKDPRASFTGDDYPDAMLNMERMGSVRALLAIDAVGGPGECRIIETSGEKAFEEKVCEVLLKRVRFTSALDSNGRPVASYYLAPNVRFQLAF